MGLGLSVNGKSCGSWSYSGFMEFRKKIAARAGIELNNMEGFSAVDKSILYEQGFSAYRKACEEEDLSQKISWDTISDPIKTLLCHSDCDGEIRPEDCAFLADRLEEIIKDWPKETHLEPPESWQTIGYPSHMIFADYDFQQATRLIAGLREAFITNMPVEFH